MTKARQINQQRLGQKGVIMPLLAVVALLLISGLIALGVDTLKVKNASSFLQQRTEYACRLAAERPTYQRLSAEAFSHALAMESLGSDPDQFDVAAFRKRDIVVSSVRFISPTMPRDGLFPSSSDPFLRNLGTTVNELGFSSLGFFPQPLCTPGPGCASDLIYRNDVRNLPRFPSTIWNNLDNVGNTVACELDAQVDTFISGKRRISAKTVWKLNLRGSDRSDPDKLPALSLVVAPHMVTDQSNNLFQFQINGPYNPLSPSPVVGFSLASNSNHTYHSSFANSEFSDDRRIAELPAVSDAAQRNDLLVACSNPAVLVRNSFLSTFTELVSRNGELRNGTEILLAATQHRTLKNGDINELPMTPNNPVLIAELGQDLVSKTFQLPYVYYDSATNVSADFGAEQGGKIDPFYDVAGSASNTAATPQVYHSLLANQLRSCYHLYADPPSGPGPGNRTLSRPYRFVFNNSFEPSAFASSNIVRSSPYGESNTSTWWDQSCAFGLGAYCQGSNMGGTRAMNAAELVSVMGTIQKCPTAVTGVESPGCAKVFDPATYSTPLPPPGDLRPDLYAAMLYLLEAEHDGNVFEAVDSPGIRPAITNDPKHPFDDDDNIMATNHYRTAATIGSTIVLVTHKRISSAEKEALRSLTAALNRQIRIIYIPTTAIDADPQAIRDLKYAFNMPDIPSPGENKIVALMPSQPNPSAADFRAYWHNALYASDQNSINSIAENTYYDLFSLDLIF